MEPEPRLERVVERMDMLRIRRVGHAGEDWYFDEEARREAAVTLNELEELWRRLGKFYNALNFGAQQMFVTIELYAGDDGTGGDLGLVLQFIAENSNIVACDHRNVLTLLPTTEERAQTVVVARLRDRLYIALVMLKPASAESVFRTISHPIRRAILDQLQDGGEQPVHQLGEPFQISQPALSQHLQVLRESGLVEARREGRERVYRLRPEPLYEVAAWIEPYARFWRDRLEALGEHLDRDDEEGSDA